jgi:hypothetical protein
VKRESLPTGSTGTVSRTGRLHEPLQDGRQRGVKFPECSVSGKPSAFQSIFCRPKVLFLPHLIDPRRCAMK